MPRRFKINANALAGDMMQTIPRESRQARTRPFSATGEDFRPVRPSATIRQHWARVLGGATLASVLAFALAISPGENPDYQRGARTLETLTQPRAQPATPATLRDHTARHKRPAREA